MKLLVIDDHPIVLDGLAALLAGSSPDAIVLTAPDARSGFKILEAHADIDVVLLDLRLPGLNGHAAISEFGRLRPTLPVIVLSSSEDPADVRKSISLGALGYVPKSASRHVLMSAINLVLKGEIYVPALLVDGSVFDRPNDRGDEARPPVSRLTERQVEVLALLSQGQPNKLIASKSESVGEDRKNSHFSNF